MRRFVLVLLLALGLLQSGCTGTSGATPTTAEPQSQAVPVRVVTVEQRVLRRTLALGGVAESARSARLAPSAQGVVSRLEVELGQEVRKGQLLAEIDSDTLRLQIQSGERSVDLARLQEQEAEREFERARALHEQGALPQQAFDQASLGLELARAQVAQAEASLAVVGGQLGNARLVAPFSGTVTGVHLEKGEFFVPMAGMGGPPALIELDALDPIRLDVHIPDVDLSRIQAGMEVAATTDAWPDREFPGEVTLVNAAADAGARTFLVRISLPNEDRALRPGLFLTARLVVDQRPEAIVVPAVAVTDGVDSPYVMVVEGTTARRTPVEPGLRGDDGWEVTGVSPGAQVVVEGQFGLPEGATVRVLQ